MVFNALIKGIDFSLEPLLAFTHLCITIEEISMRSSLCSGISLASVTVTSKFYSTRVVFDCNRCR